MVMTDFLTLNEGAGKRGFLSRNAHSRKPTIQPPVLMDVTQATPYGMAALEQECATLSAATEGSRNDQLNRSAFNLGQLVGAGALPEALVVDELTRAATECGLPTVEITKTIMSGLESGKHQPRDLESHVDRQSVSSEEHSGQMRMAHRLAESHRDKLLYVHGIGWHFWDGRRWAVDDVGAAKRAVMEVLKTALSESLNDKELRSDVRKCESASGITGVLSIAEAMTTFAATVRDMDADSSLLNVDNGTLDLRTMELRPHVPADRLTKVTRAGYRVTDDGDWQQFLATVLPDAKVRAYVQRQLGVALLGEVVEHVLPIWTGTGANGKSTAIGALSWALGDYASTAEPELLLHRHGAHPTGEMDLMGRRLIVVTETDEGRRFAESTMKRLTGGDTIRARRMRQDFVEFIPSHTTVLVTNHLPQVSGDDPAVWRRIRVVPFDVVIPAKDRDGTLPQRLARCADEVLSWCVQGWQQYQQIGLDEPDAVLTRTDEYKADSDAVGRFISDECVVSAAPHKATTSTLFTAWERWRASEGVEEMTMKAFGKALDRHGYPVTGRTQAGRWRSGIALRADQAA